MNFVIKNCLNLDYEQLSCLLLSSFRDSYAANKFSGNFSPSFLKWKYQSPAGSAQVIVCQHKGQYISCLSATPFFLEGPGGRRIAWQLGDIAVKNTFRSRGIYSQGLSLIVGSLPMDDYVFCFPNSQSAPEFHNQEFYLQDVLSFKFWYPRVFKRQAVEVNLLDSYQKFKFLNDISISGASSMHLTKDASFLNWRYKRHPINHYISIVSGEVNKPDAIFICRSVRYLNMKFLCVMDFHGNYNGKVKILSSLKNVLKFEKAAFFLTIDNDNDSVFQDYFFGVSIPSVLSPKKMNFMIKFPSRLSDDSSFSNRWSLQAGDWDGL